MLCKEIERATSRLAEIDGVLPFTELLGKGEVDEYDTELDVMVREAERVAANAAPEGDGGLWALHHLHEYFHESGNRKARQLIDDAAHCAGFCLADGGTEVLLEGNLCLVCMSELPNA